jgi:hypothetical protein
MKMNDFTIGQTYRRRRMVHCLDIFDLHSANPLGNIMIQLAYSSLISHDLYFGLGDGEILQDFHSSIVLRVGMDKIW